MSIADWFHWRRPTAGEQAEAQLQRNREACERERARREADEDRRWRNAFILLRRRKAQDRRS